MNLSSYLENKFNNNLVKLLLCFFIVSISDLTNACNIKHITNVHSSILTELNLPKNVLLSIFKNEVSIITNEGLTTQINAPGVNKFKVYQMISNRLVLKDIINSNLDLTKIEQINILKSLNFQHTIISAKGIFIFVEELGTENKPSCYTRFFYPSDSYQTYYVNSPTENKKNNKRYEIPKNLIISNLLNLNYNFDYSKAIINLKANEGHKDLAKKIHEFRESNSVAKYLTIKPERAGLQISEISIPISAYDRTRKNKDGNELFYSSSFNASNNPKLIRSGIHYNYEIGILEDNFFTSMGSQYNITNNLNTNVELSYRKAKLNISKLQLGFKKFHQNKFLFSTSLGKFSTLNTGLLTGLYKLNKGNENLINTSAFLSFSSKCPYCIRSGLSIGFEEYLYVFNGYSEINLLRQNFKTHSETKLEISLKKQLQKENQFFLSARYNLNNKSTEIEAKFIIPLKSTKININGTGSITFQSHEKELITNWSRAINKSLLENTPGFLKRNWKNYIDF